MKRKKEKHTTPDLQHVSTPNLLSAREQELADLRETESKLATYAGSKVRATRMGAGVGQPKRCRGLFSYRRPTCGCRCPV
jgi:hypothetical protein